MRGLISLTGFEGYIPLTISSSVVHAQSSASRFIRKVLEVVGHPFLRINAFHVPDSVLVYCRHLKYLYPSSLPKIVR